MKFQTYSLTAFNQKGADFEEVPFIRVRFGEITWNSSVIFCSSIAASFYNFTGARPELGCWGQDRTL